MVDEETEGGPDTAAQSVAMLRRVLAGSTYAAVAAEFGVTRTAVERRIKALAGRLSREVGIEGLSEGGTAFVGRLREHRDAILQALERFEPAPAPAARASRVVSPEEMELAIKRIRGRSAQAARDVALFYLLFATGAKPLEIARLRVKDYVDEQGEVRVESVLPASAANNGRPRPLYFASRRLVEALDLYLAQRLERRHGVGESQAWRGLDPESPLFLTPSGMGFRIIYHGEKGQHRYLCRAILEAYRKLFRYSELEGVTALSVRHTVATRLYERGADEEQVGLILGISERSAVREMFPRERPTLAVLMQDLV